MCCAMVALAMALLASWRSVSASPSGGAGWLRRIAIVAMTIGAAAGSAIAADRFAAAGGVQSASLASPARFISMPVCSHLIR